MALIHISGKSYELIIENRNGWNVEAFRNRYSEVLERYDYIVGDWGYNQLRLKGFFRDGHQKATKDTTFSYATDYINEYCNFGCAYFILEKVLDPSLLSTEDDIYIDELEVTQIELSDVDEKSASVSAVPTEGKNDSKAANQEQRKKSNPSSQKSNDDQVEKYFEKTNDKQKQRNGNRNSAKSQGEDANIANADGKKEGKSEGKPKRKENYYRKGNRSQDKKAKANKSQSEQLTTVRE